MGSQWSRLARIVAVLSMLLVTALPALAQQAASPQATPAQATPAPANPQPTPQTKPAQTLADLVAQIEQALRVRDQVLTNLLQRIDALEKELAALRSAAAPAAATVIAEASAEQLDEEERLTRAALDRALLARGGLLLPRWTMEIEQGFSYFNASSDLISIDGFSIFPVLVVGDIVSERIRRDILHVALTARVGLPAGFQADVRMPYGYEKERTVSADEIENSRSAFGASDLEVGVSRQMIRERGKVPDVLTAFHWKTATGRDPFRLNSTQPALGTGFHSVQGSVTAAKTSDPVVFYGGLSYTANLAATKLFRGLDPVEPEESTEGRFNPGNTIGVQMGMALGLNPDTSLSLGWSQRISARTTFNGTPLPGTFLSEANLRIGTSYLYAPSRAVDIGLGIGLTRDAPDFNFSMAFPFRMSLLRPRASK